MNNYTGTYRHDPTTFGGIISNYDYEGYNSMCDIAGRILSDMKFDKQCKINGENRDRNKKFKKGVKPNDSKA